MISCAHLAEFLPWSSENLFMRQEGKVEQGIVLLSLHFSVILGERFVERTGVHETYSIHHEFGDYLCFAFFSINVIYDARELRKWFGTTLMKGTTLKNDSEFSWFGTAGAMNSFYYTGVLLILYKTVHKCHFKVFSIRFCCFSIEDSSYGCGLKTDECLQWWSLMEPWKADYKL